MIKEVGFTASGSANKENVLTQHLFRETKGCLLASKLSRDMNYSLWHIGRRGVVFQQSAIYDFMTNRHAISLLPVVVLNPQGSIAYLHA